MSKILVTGASGDIGRKTLLQLLKRRPASQLTGLARDPVKASDLAALGIEIRQGDYYDTASLDQAFADIEKVMFVSTHAFTDRKTAHANVVNAAAKAGVSHVVYMPILRKPNSGFVLKEITEEDKFTEELLASSGLAYTLAKHPPFIDFIAGYIGPAAADKGVRVPAGSGRFAPASRSDLAEAHAVILSGEGHEGKSYALYGDPAISFADVAKILSEARGKEVPYIQVSDKEFVDLKVAEGWPEFIGQFALGWLTGMNRGEWDKQGNDLETLIGRKPQTAAEFLRNEYATPKPQPDKPANQEL